MAVLWWLWATTLGRLGEFDINEFLQYCSSGVGWQRGTLRQQGGAVLHWDKGGTQSDRGIGWCFNHLLGWQRWLSNGWWRVKNLLKELDQVWLWGLLVVGSKGLGWWVSFWWLDTCGPVGIDRWFSDVGLVEMWRRDFEGGMVAEFLVVKNTVNVFFFFFCLVLDWLAMMLQTNRCLLWYQNWRRTTRTKLNNRKNKWIWPRSQHLGLVWSQHQARKPLGVST